MDILLMCSKSIYWCRLLMLCWSTNAISFNSGNFIIIIFESLFSLSSCSICVLLKFEIDCRKFMFGGSHSLDDRDVKHYSIFLFLGRWYKMEVIYIHNVIYTNHCFSVHIPTISSNYPTQVASRDTFNKV